MEFQSAIVVCAFEGSTNSNPQSRIEHRWVINLSSEIQPIYDGLNEPLIGLKKGISNMQNGLFWFISSFALYC